MFEKVKSLLVEYMGIDKTQVTMDARLIKDLAMNSLELAEFILTCEDEFGVSVRDEDLKKLVTVGDVVEYLEKL